MSNRFLEAISSAISGSRSDQILSGSGAPASTPVFIGQRYIDTTGKREYYAVGISSSADWRKVAKFASGTVLLTAGGGDKTVTLDFDWSGGRLIIDISGTSTDYFHTGTSSAVMHLETSYIALTSGSYTDGQIMRHTRNDAGTPEIDEAIKSLAFAGLPKSATTTTFVLHDTGATTKYIKWFVIA